MTDPAKIAEGLTEAQRRALLSVRDWPHDGLLVTNAFSIRKPTRLVLQRLALILLGHAACITCVFLTPLGLAVRTHLQREKPNG